MLNPKDFDSHDLFIAALRDYFAGHAPPVPEFFEWRPDEAMAQNDILLNRLIAWQWRYADLMLAERWEKEEVNV